MEKAFKYEEYKIEIIHLTEANIITTSGDPFKDHEGWFISGIDS